MAAKTVRKIPFQIAVRVMSLFTKLRIRFGNTGAINPRATMSSMTVTKMNGIAACRLFIAREESTQRCTRGCVNRRKAEGHDRVMVDGLPRRRCQTQSIKSRSYAEKPHHQ